MLQHIPRWVDNIAAGVSKLGSHHRGSNARSSKPITMEEIHKAVQACNFCIAITIKEDKRIYAEVTRTG